MEMGEHIYFLQLHITALASLHSHALNKITKTKNKTAFLVPLHLFYAFLLSIYFSYCSSHGASYIVLCYCNVHPNVTLMYLPRSLSSDPSSYQSF